MYSFQPRRKADSGNSYEKGDASGYINLRHLNTLIIYMMLSCYLMNSSSRYFGSGQSESSTINSNLSIW